MIAIIHPGQGGVFPGMFDKFSSPIIKNTVEEASDILKKDIYKLTRTLTKEELSLSENAQICATILNVAIDRLWTFNQGLVSYRSGHSVGEMSAYCAAGSFSFADMLVSVEKRAASMSKVLEPGVGGMMAIRDITIEQFHELLTGVDLDIACYNSYDRFAVSGLSTDILEFKRKLDNLKITNSLLSMSIPCHSKFMKPCVEEVRHILSDIKINSPLVPVMTQNGFDTDIADGLASRIELPVIWTNTINNLVKEKITKFIITGSELGYFHLMIRSMFPHLTTVVISDDQSFDAALMLCIRNRESII